MEQLPSKKRIKAIERFNRGKVLGQGAFGKVFQATDVLTNQVVAVKQIFPREGGGIDWTALREVKLLRELQHENIISLIEVFSSTSDANVNIVFEFCDHDLQQVILADVPFQSGDVQSFLKMTLSGIQACHQSWVLHRDLKPSNLLISPQGILKLGDFGLARMFAEDEERTMSSNVVTLWYRAPELLMGARRYGTGIDLFAIGLIFAELITRVTLLKGHNEIDQLTKTFHLLGTPTHESWPDVTLLPHYLVFTPSPPTPLSLLFPGESPESLDLLQWMLKLDPQQRPSSVEALGHAYFTGENAVAPTLPLDLPKPLTKLKNR